MTSEAIVMNPLASSRLPRLSHPLAALRKRLGRFGRARRRDAGFPRDVVEVGSIVRVFAVDTLRETRLILAPSGWAGTSPSMVPADSPIGAALLGGRVGDTRPWGDPSGPNRLMVVEIIGRMPETVWESATERRAAPQRALEAGTSPSREVPARRPVALPLPAAA
jgi:hypothetical protein